MHPEVLRLFSLWDLIQETTPSDRKAQGRPPTTSWPGDVPTSPGPGKVFHHIPWETLERTPIPLNNWVHPYQPGDEIWVKDWKKEPFQPIWTGPHMVILRTPTADKVTDIPWIYHPRVKKAAASCDEDPWKAVWDSKSLLKVQFQRQRPSPMKDTEPCSLLWKLTSQHTAEVWQNQYNIVKEKKKKLEDSSSLFQPRSSSWLVNARQKLEDSAIKISMDFHCQCWPLSLIGIIAVLFATGPTSYRTN